MKIKMTRDPSGKGKNKKELQEKLRGYIWNDFMYTLPAVRNDLMESRFYDPEEFRDELTPKRISGKPTIHKGYNYDWFACQITCGQFGSFLIEKGSGNRKKIPKVIDVRKHKHTFPLLFEDGLEGTEEFCFITTSPELAKTNNAYCKKNEINIRWMAVLDVDGSVNHHTFEVLTGKEKVFFLKDRSYNSTSSERSNRLAVDILKELYSVGCVDPLCFDYYMSFNREHKCHMWHLYVQDLHDLTMFDEILEVNHE